mmetsp:Transcript_24517/g.47663  ORF Transcript_24517/g.47663 Transcript_24517/m.47663 type:complete len:278 (+) Transcript_24517:1268-2101(+)
MVTRVLVALNKLGSLRVGAGDDDGLRPHDVALEAGGHQAVDVLAGRDKHLAAHVPALLGAVPLVLKMDAGSAGVDHQLGQAHHGGHAAVARVAVGHDGAEVVDGVFEVVLGPHGLKLLAVVELLRAEQAVDVLGHRVEGVVREVGAGLVDRRVVGGGLPARDVDGLSELNHLGQLGVVEAPESCGAPVLVAQVAHKLVQLGRRERRGGAGPLDGAAEAGDVSGAVVAERALEALAGHPLVDLLNARLVRDHVPCSLLGAAHAIGRPHRAGRRGGREA